MSLSSPFTYHPDGRDPGDSFVPFQCPVVSTSRHSENIKLRLFGAKRRTRTPLKHNIASLQLSSKVKPWSDGWQLQCRRSKQAHKILCVHKESGRSAMERKQTSYSPGGKVEILNVPIASSGSEGSRIAANSAKARSHGSQHMSASAHSMTNKAPSKRCDGISSYFRQLQWSVKICGTSSPLTNL